MFPAPSQANFDTSPFTDFQAFIGENKQLGRTCEEKEAKYVSFSVLREYWTEEKIDQIFARCDISIIARVVRQHYLLVFSILVYISPVDGLHLLDQFRYIQANQTDDHTLPWLQCPEHVFEGTHTSRIFESFSEHQWMFCPVTINQENLMSDRKLNPLHVLPIAPDLERCIPRNERRDAELSVIKIDAQAHSHLGGVTPERAVVKRYKQEDREAYDDERKAYEALCGKLEHPNVLRYLGSFRCGQTFSILLEFAEEGTMDDLFQRNVTPHTYDEFRAFWKSIIRLVEGVEMVHTTSVVHQDLKPSNIFVFKNTSLGPSPFSYTFKIGDFGNSYVRPANHDGQDRDGPHRGGSRIYDPPEVILADTIPYQVNKPFDIWGIGCIIIECAVWVEFGKRGLDEFWNSRLRETSQSDGHRELGHGACFHDGVKLLKCVGEDVADKLKRNRRICDTITPAMVDLMVQCALVEENVRDRAQQLIGKMKMQKCLPPEPVTPKTAQPVAEHSDANTTGRFSSETQLSGQMHRQGPGSNFSNNLSRNNTVAVVTTGPIKRPAVEKSETFPTGNSPLVNGSNSVRSGMTVSNITAQALSTKVTIKDVVKWIEDTKRGIETQLPGWDSARKLLGGRDFFLIIDNSKFMQEEKKEVLKVVKALSYLLKKLDRDGIEVACTSSPGNMKRYNSATDIERFISNEFHSGHDTDCNIEHALNVVVDKVKNKYLRQSRSFRLSRIGTFPSNSSTTDGISIFVFTNGQWDSSETGRCGADQSIRRLITEMETRNASRTQICFQFIRFGNSETGRQRLRFLDDDLGKTSHNATYDIVDCKPTTAHVWDILSGPLSPGADNTEDS